MAERNVNRLKAGDFTVYYTRFILTRNTQTVQFFNYMALFSSILPMNILFYGDKRIQQRQQQY